MPSPPQYALLEFEAPYGESTNTYAPANLARRVKNLERTPQGTLRSVRGPCPYEPDRGGGNFVFGRIHGVFHAGLKGGKAPTLIVRAGTKLYRHAGWDRTFEELESGLSDDNTIRQVDQFVVMNDNIIWSNGIDRPRVITYQGAVFPLGFTETPGAPFPEGPTVTPSADSNEGVDRSTSWPNDLGYSWPGNKGTLGDVRNPTEGSVLGSAHYYYEQWQDQFGNLSPLSARSAAVLINPQSSQETYTAQTTGNNALGMQGVLVDDLLRQFVVRMSGTAPNHVTGRRVYATPDTRNVGTTPGLLTVHEGVRPVVIPDRWADAELGPPPLDVVPVPTFHIMCAHNGRLIVAVHGRVLRSEPNFPGTFLRYQEVQPDDGGASITALKSYNGSLYAWTDRGMFDISDFDNPVQISGSIGCAASDTVEALPDGSLVWLAYDGWYQMGRRSSSGRRSSRSRDSGRDGYGGYSSDWEGSYGPPRPGTRNYPELVSGMLHEIVRDELNRYAMRQATATFDPRSGEYRCAVTPSGRKSNRLIVCFDGEFFREQDLGVDVEAMCTTDDARQYVLMGGRDTNDTPLRTVFVADHEYEDYTAPSRTYSYQSQWIRGDKLALKPFKVREAYIGIVDSYNGSATWTNYRDRQWVQDEDTAAVQTIGLDHDDDNPLTNYYFGATPLLGTVKCFEPRLHFREVRMHLSDVREWAFKLESATPMEIASFAFSLAPAGSIEERYRTPPHDETPAT